MKKALQYLVSGVLGVVLVALAIVLATGMRLPADRLFWAARVAAYGNAGAILESSEQSNVAGVGIVLRNGRVKDAEKNVVALFDEIGVKLGLLPLLYGKAGADVWIAEPRGGTLDVQADYMWGDVSLDVHAKDFSLSPVNAALRNYGVRLTGAVDLDLDLVTTPEAPGELSGSVELNSENLRIFGGPLLSGFGLETLQFIKIHGAHDINAGKIQGMKVTLDGDAIYGLAELDLSLKPDFSGGNYAARPQVKFGEELEDKLASILPLTGLKKNPQGYYTKNFRGRF